MSQIEVNDPEFIAALNPKGVQSIKAAGLQRMYAIPIIAVCGILGFIIAKVYGALLRLLAGNLINILFSFIRPNYIIALKDGRKFLLKYGRFAPNDIQTLKRKLKH